MFALFIRLLTFFEKDEIIFEMLRLHLVFVFICINSFGEQLLGNFVIFQKQPPEVFFIDVLKNFPKLTGKYLELATLLKNGLWQKCCPVSFGKYLRTPFFQNDCL